VIGVLLRLQALSIRGRFVRSLRLLRQPKYLVGSIAGALWMMVWVGRPLLRSNPKFRSVGFDMVPPDVRPTVHLAVALVVTILIVLPWLWPWGKPGMRFREAELTLLLQAPLTRRQVIGYGLLRAGLGTLISATLLSWVVGRGVIGRLSLFAAILPLFTFWGLNGKWRAMFLLDQGEHPRAARRRAILTAVCGTYLATLVLLTLRFLPQLVESKGTHPWPTLLATLLLPGKLLTAPLLAQGVGAVLLATLPVALLAVVQLELVLRSRAPFEESSLEWAKEHDARQAAGRRRVRSRGTMSRRWQAFDLPSAGKPEVAILWKNVMRVSRLPVQRAIAGVAVLLVTLVVLAWILPIYPAIYGAIAIAGLVAAGTAPLFAGMSWQNDLRTELSHLELVRTWPVPPVRFVLAEVASPALLSTLVGLSGLGIAFAGYVGQQIASARGGSIVLVPNQGALGVSATTLVILALLGFVPLLAGAAFATAAMQNVATLFVPAWMIQTPDTQRGIAAIGRNLILGTANFFGFFFALLPSALLVGLAILGQRLAGIPWTAWAFPVWGILAAAPLFVLGGMLVLFAGTMWSDLDPSEELLEIGR
jgi:hypothetical protein